MRRWPDVGLLLVHRLRRWPNRKPTLAQRLMVAGILGHGGVTDDSVTMQLHQRTLLCREIEIARRQLMVYFAI